MLKEVTYTEYKTVKEKVYAAFNFYKILESYSTIDEQMKCVQNINTEICIALGVKGNNPYKGYFVRMKRQDF